MEFRRIFGNKNECNFWAVCYKEDKIGNEKIDVFRKLFSLWNDTRYLHAFFKKNENLLATNFWNYISITDSIDKVLDEAENFEMELKGVETNQPGYENISLKDIFDYLHEEAYTFIPGNAQQKKGKPNFDPPMLRVYAIELEDGCYIVTGGGIKLTEKMDAELENEIEKIKKVQQYLKSEGIFSKEGLEDFETK